MRALLSWRNVTHVTQSYISPCLPALNVAPIARRGEGVGVATGEDQQAGREGGEPEGAVPVNLSADLGAENVR